MHTRTPLPFDAAKEGLSRRSLLGLTTAGLVAPLLQACGGGSRSATDLASVQWTRQTILEALNRPGTDMTALSVALFAGDRVVWSEAFGTVNRETGRKATVDTRFNVGSVAKVFAALPDAAPGGLTMAAWAEGPAVKASMNLSAAEFKWFVKMFTDFAAQDAAAQAAFEAEALSEKAGVEDDDAEDIVVIDDEDDEADAPAAPAAPAAE